MNNNEVCFSPVLFPDFRNQDAIVVIVDILRPASAIVTAFENGAELIIPVRILGRELISSGEFETICDSTKASIDLYDQASKDLTRVIPILRNNHLEALDAA